MKIFKDITKTVGNTPLVQMNRLSNGLSANIWLKLEFFNPLGSVKDRIGLNMIEDAEHSGVLRQGMEVIEPTSGNTGIALAFVCAAKGYRLTLVMPETMSQERRALLLLLGANLVLTPGPLGMRGAIAKSMELRDLNPESFIPSQFENPANPEIHRRTTAEEIWRDTDGTVDILVSGVGTGGTATGVAEVIKSRKPKFRLIVVEPLESSVISSEKPAPHKIQGIGAGFIPTNLNTAMIDGIERVSSEEAIRVAKQVIKAEGIPVGISSGAAIAAALRIAKLEENAGKNIVVIIPSYTERYLSTALAEQERKTAMEMVTSPVDEKYLSRVSLRGNISSKTI